MRRSTVTSSFNCIHSECSRPQGNDSAHSVRETAYEHADKFRDRAHEHLENVRLETVQVFSCQVVQVERQIGGDQPALEALQPVAVHSLLAMMLITRGGNPPTRPARDHRERRRCYATCRRSDRYAR